jgi:hypothetical protein
MIIPVGRLRRRRSTLFYIPDMPHLPSSGLIFTPTGATRMKISAAFPPVPATPDHIALAEKLGYSTAWVYDTPALQLDC